MKISKKTLLELFGIFFVFFVIKTVLSLLMNGPFIFSDEPCVVQKAVYFVENFNIKPCYEILDVHVGDPYPLYSVLISIIYLFFSKSIAYYLILALNSFLVSTLIFPLYFIFKKFLKNDRIIYLSSILLILLPQVVMFEKTVMTETLFLVINIWLLHFYLNSFGESKHKVRNKAISFILAVLAALTRPFGFIVPLALAINESILSRKKKYLLFFIPFAVLVAVFVIWGFMPNFWDYFDTSIKNFKGVDGFILLIKSIKNQINSFTVATFFIPIILFFSGIFKKDSEYLKKIRWFILALLAMNFMISAQHIEISEYTGEIITVLNTRYISISVVFIFLFAFIFLNRYKKYKFDLLNSVVLSILVLCLIFWNYEFVKHSLNIDLSIYYNTNVSDQDNLVDIKNYVIISLLGIYTIMLVVLALNKRKILMGLIAVMIVVHSVLSTIWVIDFSKLMPSSEAGDYLLDKDYKVLFIERQQDVSTNISFWLLLVFSDSYLRFKVISDDMPMDIEEITYELSPEMIDGLRQDYDYIISCFKMNLPLMETFNTDVRRGIKYEYLYKL